MLINIPDDIWEREMKDAFGKMPPTKNINPKGRRKSSPVLYRIGYEIHKTPHLYLTMLLIYKAIWKWIADEGIIIYDQESDSWKGAGHDNN